MEKYFCKSDWHLHTGRSCDCYGLLPASNLPQYMKESGIEEIGITDHLHTLLNMPDILASYNDFLGLNDENIHFGIELSVVTQWEIDRLADMEISDKIPVYGIRFGGPQGGALNLALSSEEIERLKLEYVVAGVHWPMYVPLVLDELIQDYHRQNMFLATDPRVDIIAHPWWWDNKNKNNGQQWADDFSLIPKSMHNEFIATVKEYGKMVEINTSLLLSPIYSEKFKKQYVEFLREIFESGIKMTIGSDSHKAVYKFPQLEVEAILRPAGFVSSDFARPDFRKVLHERKK